MKKFPVFFSAVATALCLVSSSAFAIQISTPQICSNKGEEAVTAASPTVYAERVAYLCNMERKKEGLPELLYSPTIARASQVRADEISVYFNHTRPNGSQCQTALEEYNVDWRAVGENISQKQITPEDAVKSWMNSPIHKQNILNSDYTYIGVGVTDAHGYISWSQFFVKTGSPDSSAYSPRNFGDVTQDGIVDAIDASAVLLAYADTSVGKTSSLNETQQTLADMNSDNIVDANDASIILNMYAINSTLD